MPEGAKNVRQEELQVPGTIATRFVLSKFASQRLVEPDHSATANQSMLLQFASEENAGLQSPRSKRR
jgi:hypothetical protein